MSGNNSISSAQYRLVDASVVKNGTCADKVEDVKLATSDAVRLKMVCPAIAARMAGLCRRRMK